SCIGRRRCRRQAGVHADRPGGARDTRRSERKEASPNATTRMMPAFPNTRPRRLRRTSSLRALVRETRLSAEQLVLPLFVRSGEGVRKPVGAMPGVAQLSVDEMLRDAEAAAKAGVGG